MKKYLLIAAVVFPIVVLLGVMLSKQAQLSQGSQVVLPIAGFDPRDLLSGHYLTYRINYGASPDCYRVQGGGQKLYACLSEEFGPENFYRARFIGQDDMADSGCSLFHRRQMRKRAVYRRHREVLHTRTVCRAS